MITAVVIVALIGCLVGSVLIGRNVRLAEYTSNRSRSGFADILFTILGSLVGGWMFFGLSAVGYEAGVVGYAIGIGYAIGLVVLALAVPRIKQAMDESHCDTMDDLVGVRFGRVTQICVTFVNLLFFLAVLAAQFIAMSAFLRVFADVEGPAALYVAIFVVLAYTALTGFKGVLFTDRWQFYIIALTAAVIFLVLGWDALRSGASGLESRYYTGMGYGAGFLIGVLLFFPPSLLVRTDLWQRVAAARSAGTAQKAMLVAAPILLVFYVVLTTVGMFGRMALGPGHDPETSGFTHFLALVRNSPDQPLSGVAVLGLSVMSVGVFAALLSTADTNLNIVAVALSKVIKSERWAAYESDPSDKFVGARTPTEESLLRTTRAITVGLGLLAVLVAHKVPDIVDLMVSAASAIMVFLPAVLATLFFQRRSMLPALASIISGTAVLVVFLMLSPKIAFLPATLTSLLVFCAITFMIRFRGRHNVC